MRTVARPPYGLPNMKKRKPKQTASEKANRAAPVGNGETANPSGGRSGAAQAQGAQAQGTAGDYFRKQVQAFISNLKTDCAYICDAVNESLYNDGAGLLEDESIRAPLGRIAYIDNFIRYFGVWLNFGDCAAFLSDILPDNLTMENGAYDMKVLERVPAIDKELLKDILDTGDDETSMYNFTLYIFSLWVNYHVGAVVSMFRKWLNVCANVPAVLRDVSELARCTCVYTRTADNAAGGIFYDGRWFETFASCGIKRQAANGCAQGAAADRKPDAGANGGTDGQTAGHIGTWAKAQGATAYIVGVSVCIRGTVCQLPPIDQKRGRVVADLIESEDYLGAVKCDFHSAMGGDTSSAEYEKIAGFVERVNAGKRGKSADRNFSGCWHIKPKPATAE